MWNDLTPWATPETGECPVADTLRAIGGKHKPRILHCLLMSDLHFLELTRAMAPISRKVLTQQLRDPQSTGLISRAETHEARRRVMHALSDKGRALGDILAQVYGWAETYKEDA